MRLWAEALDIAHATRMKIDSDEPRCRGVTAVGVPVRGAYDGASGRFPRCGGTPALSNSVKQPGADSLPVWCGFYRSAGFPGTGAQKF